MIETINKLVRTGAQMLHEIGREPTPEELAEKLQMPLEKVRKVMKIAKEPISLETPIGDEEDSQLGDFIEDKNAILPLESAIQLNLKETTTRVLASLTPREERVLRMRFGIGMNTDHTLEEVGQQFSVTRERIRQIEAKALQEAEASEPVTEAAELPGSVTGTGSLKRIPLACDDVFVFDIDVATTNVEYRTIFAQADACAGTGKRVRILNRVRSDAPEPGPSIHAAMNWMRIATSDAIDRYAVLGADPKEARALSATRALFPKLDIRGFSASEESDALAWLGAEPTQRAALA